MRKEKSLFSWVLAGHGLDYFRSRDEWNSNRTSGDQYIPKGERSCTDLI